MHIQENYSLKSHNTFGVAAQARWFVAIEQESDLVDLYSQEWIKPLHK